MADQKIENLLKIIAGGGFIIFVGSIIGKILRFAFFVCLTRVLGASLFGLYSIGQSIVDSVTNIGLLGDGRGFIRFAASFIHDGDTPRLKGMVQSYIGVCLLLSIVIAASLFFGAGYLSFCRFHNSALIGVLKIFALSIPFYILALIVIHVGYAFQRMEYKVIIQEVSQPVINIVTIIIIFALGGRLYGAVTGFFVSSFITAILGFYLLKSLCPEVLSKSKCIFETKKLIIYSLPLIGIIFCYYLLFRLDRIMLGIYRTPFEVGIYSVASNTAIGIIAFSGIFEACFAPVIAQLYHSNKKEELAKIYNCITSWGMALSFIPCVILLIFNKEILLLFGKDFTSARFALIILSISYSIEIIPGQLRQLFQMSSHQNLEFINSLLMITLNLILNLIFIPLFGIVGAASAFLLTAIIISIIRVIELKVIFGFLPFNSRYLKFLLFAAFAVFISLLTIINMGFILELIIAIFILAFFVWFIFKFKSEEDIILWNMFRSKIVKYEPINE